MSDEERSCLKCPGGKGALLEHLRPLLPPRRSIRRYGEPFCGGGAMYLHEFADHRPAWLGDADPWLMMTWRVIQSGDLGELCRLLAEHKRLHTEKGADHYYPVRDAQPDKLSPEECAARFIYLSKTGFNGLRRYNRNGRYNVPMGKYANPSICEPDVLRWNRTRIQGVDLRCGDLSTMIVDAAEDDFYFMDPPYIEMSDTAKFVGYTPSGFTQADHARVASCYRWLSMRGVRALLTNSDTPRTRELYAGFRIVEYGASRSINSKKAGRGMVREVAVLNY